MGKERGRQMSEPETPISAEQVALYKQQAAERAVEYAQSGMTIGLGTGSTAIFATRRIAELIREGQLKDVAGFATSKAVFEEARRLNIPMIAEDMPRGLDLTIDGADEVDPGLNLIKGGGGALLREKIAAQASERLVIVVDEGKFSPKLGANHTLPVEVLPYGWLSQRRFLESLSPEVKLRVQSDGSPFITDSGNLILDCSVREIDDFRELAFKLNQRAGIVEHGLFLGMVTDLIAAGPVGINHFAPATARL
jgi:ribose 5-phosphate isomerase A